MNSQERETMSAAATDLSLVEPNGRLGQLFADHYRRVLIAAYRIVGNIADAEDVAQGVFLRIGSTSATEVANAGSYLYRAAINGALDVVRHRQKTATEPLDLAASVPSTAGASSPEAELANRELSQVLRRAVGELPARAAEMFALRYLEDCDNREISKLLGTSAAVVAVTLHQARSKLKKRLIELQRGKR
jgi:RNA polymerase sigma-70 factor (ECF subfamily)